MVRELSQSGRTTVGFPSRSNCDLKVALITPYFPFFDGVFPDEYRARQDANAQRLADSLRAAGCQVGHYGLADGVTVAREQGHNLKSGQPDVAIVAPMMAAPGTYTLAALEELDVPVVLCQAIRRDRFGPDYDEVDATEDSTLLGGIMAAGALEGRGRRFVTCTVGPDGDVERVLRVARGAAAGPALRGRRIGIVGSILEGYLDVELSEEHLQELGFVGVRLPGDALLREFEHATQAATDQVHNELVAYAPEVDLSRDALERDLRLAAALMRLVQDSELDALVVNCHDELFRRGETVGIPACLGATAVATSDRPVTCTGDVSTAIALLVAREFTRDVLYCEPYAFENETAAAVLGSCGIGNLAVASPRWPRRIGENYAYPGCRAHGACVRFGIEPGPATILAYAPGGGLNMRPSRLIWMSGELAGTHFSGMHGPNGVFTPSGGHGALLWDRWMREGPAHHLALAASDLTIELSALATLSDLAVTQINVAATVDQ